MIYAWRMDATSLSAPDVYGSTDLDESDLDDDLDPTYQPDSQAADAPDPQTEAQADGRAQMFHNRLRKNLRRLKPWIKNRALEAYRIYDCDIPEVRLIVERYADNLVVWEYARRADRNVVSRTPGESARERFLSAVVSALITECAVDPAAIFVKRRERQQHKAQAARSPGSAMPTQYEKLAAQRHEQLIHEGGHAFWVNLSDYLDTGLFLDHREARALVGKMSAGKRVLNLFGYTGSFSVYAAGGGALSTLTVDLSATYLAWAGRNFAQNRMDPERHQLLRADVVSMLRERSPQQSLAAALRSASLIPGEVNGRQKTTALEFDLIVLDPPTFSNSKRMHGTLDILRDHPWLISQGMRLLAPGGSLLFSCNHRSFVLRPEDIEAELKPHLRGRVLNIRDLSTATLPRDFHGPRPRCCFLISYGS